MKDVVAALRVLKVPVVAIPDFDIIDDSAKLKSLCISFRIDWSSVSECMSKVYACINSDGGRIRSLIKENGSSIFIGDAPAAFITVDKVFRSAGLYIVPVGEIESFDKTINNTNLRQSNRHKERNIVE